MGEIRHPFLTRVLILRKLTLFGGLLSLSLRPGALPTHSGIHVLCEPRSTRYARSMARVGALGSPGRDKDKQGDTH